MSSGVKWILAIVAIFVLANGYRYLSQKQWAEEFSPDHKPDVVDAMIGRTSLDRLEEIREKRDTFNLPAFKTGLVMFYTTHGRYPQNIEELERSGEVNSSITRDQHGIPFQLEFQDNTALVRSAGADRIMGSTDDVQYSIPL
ncbi:MAG: hypothetical protein ACOX5R_06110 [bacterium]|jgi:hypothetical protein